MQLQEYERALRLLMKQHDISRYEAAQLMLELRKQWVDTHVITNSTK